MYKNNVRMNDISGVNRVIQRTINALIQGDIEEGLARSIFYGCNILYKGLQIGDIEARLEELEKQLPNRRVG